jgi:hypothetical protein
MKHRIRFVPIVLALSLVLALALGACSAPDASADSPFKYYRAVNIGMTQAQVAAATGLTGVAETSSFALPNTFNYMDADKVYGVSVVLTDDLTVYSKTVLYPDHKVLAPLTAKPISQTLCDAITDGMPRAEVVALLGGPGVECSRTVDSKDGTTPVGTIERWGNKDGSIIQIAYTSDDTAHTALFFKGR